MHLPRLASLAATMLALTALTAGCFNPGGPDEPTARPSPLSTPLTGRWTTLATPCPTLTGETAKSLSHSGQGAPGPGKIDTPVVTSVACSWGQGEGSVGAHVYLNRVDGPLPADQMAAQQFQEQFDEDVADGSILHWRPEPDLADKAYLGIYRDQANLVLWVLSSNARIVVYHRIPRLEKDQFDAALDEYRDTMRGLAADILDDLS